LPETNVQAARSVAERIREMVQSNALAINDAKLALTGSVGVAEPTVKSSGIEEVLRDADRAHYDADRPPFGRGGSAMLSVTDDSRGSAR
jgi:PleD family two-component response regulator